MYRSPPPPVARACEGLLFWSAMVAFVVALIIATNANEIHLNIYAAAFFIAGSGCFTGAIVIRALS